VTDGIPDFLIIPQEERRAAWKGRRLTVQGSGFRRVDKAEEAERKRLQKLYDEQQKEKRAARLAAFLESRR
jgi:hypothetical protein